MFHKHFKWPMIQFDYAQLCLFTGSYREIEVAITDSESVTVTADEAPLLAKPKSSVKPTNIRLVREVELEGGNYCTTVCNYQNQTYAGLDEGAVVRIGPDYKVTPFISLSNHVTGMSIHNGITMVTHKL